MTPSGRSWQPMTSTKEPADKLPDNRPRQRTRSGLQASGGEELALRKEVS